MIEAYGRFRGVTTSLPGGIGWGPTVCCPPPQPLHSLAKSGEWSVLDLMPKALFSFPAGAQQTSSSSSPERGRRTVRLEIAFQQPGEGCGSGTRHLPAACLRCRYRPVHTVRFPWDVLPLRQLAVVGCKPGTPRSQTRGAAHLCRIRHPCAGCQQKESRRCRKHVGDRRGSG